MSHVACTINVALWLNPVERQKITSQYPDCTFHFDKMGAGARWSPPIERIVPVSSKFYHFTHVAHFPEDTLEGEMYCTLKSLIQVVVKEQENG